MPSSRHEIRRGRGAVYYLVDMEKSANHAGNKRAQPLQHSPASFSPMNVKLSGIIGRRCRRARPDIGATAPAARQGSE
jgi:hypothetical protein